MENTFEKIEKEAVESLLFPAEDVLANDKNAATERLVNLQRAQALGNLDHVKIQIYFEDNLSRKRVETTIWGVTDKEIILKQGVVIPIHRIFKTI